VDLNNDGYMDIVSGKYLPNDITWFKGSKKGFEKGIIIKEKRNKSNSEDSFYISVPCFADIDGDKDLDLFVSTAESNGAILFNRNIGSPEKPKYKTRNFLFTIKGDTIKASCLSFAIVDWDNDNILDIISTKGYLEESGVGSFIYYKGLGNERFESAVPIPIPIAWTIGIKNEKNKRAVPGSYWGYKICVTDWNNDGKTDLLIGSGILYKNGKPFDKLNNLTGDAYSQLINNITTYQEIQECGVIYLLLGQ
jgi:hypothetical protein